MSALEGEHLEPVSAEAVATSLALPRGLQRARDFSLGFSGPSGPPVSDLRSLEVSHGPGAWLSLSFFLPMARWVTQTCHPTPLRDSHSFHTPTATLTCLNSSRGVSVPALQVTLAAYLTACLYPCSNIPLVFPLPHSSLEVEGWEADSQRNGLRSSPPPPLPLLHMPLCIQAASGCFLGVLGPL